MDKVYFFTDEEAGLEWLGPDADRLTHEDFEPFPDPRFNWPAFPSFEPTKDPNKADIFVIRQRLSKLPHDKVYELANLHGPQERHVFFDLVENYTTYPGLDCIFLRGSTKNVMIDENPNSISWPWPTEDHGEHMTTPAGGWQYDVGFMGQANDTAMAAMNSIKDSGLTNEFYVNTTFWPHICEADPAAGKQLRLMFLGNMKGGRLSLCPMSLDGVIRYRFYEAMSMARVNVHLCDNCVLPMQDKIDWNRCVITIKEADAPHAGELLSSWLELTSDEEIWEMGLYAREMWTKWLWRGNWDKNVDLVVREKLGI